MGWQGVFCEASSDLFTTSRRRRRPDSESKVARLAQGTSPLNSAEKAPARLLRPDGPSRKQPIRRRQPIQNRHDRSLGAGYRLLAQERL